MERTRRISCGYILEICLSISLSPVSYFLAIAALTATKKRPVSQSKLKVVVDLAFRFQKDYKMVVYEVSSHHSMWLFNSWSFQVEKHIRKAPPDEKLCGVYVMDSICKQARELLGKSNDLFTPRFAIRLKETLSPLNTLSREDQVT